MSSHLLAHEVRGKIARNQFYDLKSLEIPPASGFLRKIRKLLAPLTKRTKRVRGNAHGCARRKTAKTQSVRGKREKKEIDEANEADVNSFLPLFAPESALARIHASRAFRYAAHLLTRCATTMQPA